MLSRLTRIFLALVTAFVFTGQMEAAAQHCARLAKAAAIVAAAETAAPPCHESNTSAQDAHMAMDHHAQSTQAAPDHSGHVPSSKSPPHCECIAALTGWTGAMGATVSTHVESYAWLTPAEAPFASAKPDPDFRPPRA